MAEAIDRPASRLAADQGRAFLRVRCGEFALAIADVGGHRALRLVVNLPPQLVLSDSLLGYACARGGRVSEAIPTLEQAVDQATAMGLMVEQALRATWLGEAYLLAGRIDYATRLARSALASARAHEERGNEAYALRLLGEIEARHGSARRDAGTHYQRSIVLAGESGMRPLVDQCHREMASLGLGDRAGAPAG